MMGAATEKARLPRFSLVLGIVRYNSDTAVVNINCKVQ